MENEKAYLGTGWSFPPEFSTGGRDVIMVYGQEDIIQSIMLLLSTRMGERLMRPEFGCDLSRYVFGEMNDGMKASIRSAIIDALLRYEPRIKVNKITVTESATNTGVLVATIDYTIRSTNSRFSMIYPFYITEASSQDLSSFTVL
jgi:uncharacterized protein